MALEAVLEALGGEDVFGGPVRSPLELEARVRDGLPKQALSSLASHLASAPAERLKVLYAIVPRATWNRRRTHLSTAESEVVERLGRLWAQALRVWESEPDARAFLTTPHTLLAGRTPLDMAHTELGGRQVERILNGLEYGLPV
jgi:putative toxin-antitoxin system antitoxin component (TIGR02293 family)